MVQNLAISIPSINLGDAYSLEAAPSEASSTPTSNFNFTEVPLTALSKNTKKQLSYLLNSKKMLRSEDGYERDWRGIAVLAQQNALCDETSISGDDPMLKVLKFWCTNNPKTATIANLEKYLGIIDRWDVSDDAYENFVEDARVHYTQLQKKRMELENRSMEDSTQIDQETNAKSNDFGLGSDPNILTNDDVLRAQKGLPPQKYDAFVLFAVADTKYAVEMIEKLEENLQHSFKLCLKDRDLLAGVSFAHVALTQLIEERCKHLIVILTEEFIKSPENKFLVNYTQALQIQNKTRKIIPLLYDDSVVIPRTLKIYTHLKYSANVGPLFNFWDKLAASIRNVSLVPDTNAYTKDLNNHNTSKVLTDPTRVLLAKCPAPPTEIPSISVNGQALVGGDNMVIMGETNSATMPKKKERMRFPKRSSLRHSSNKSLLPAAAENTGSGMRNALSTSHLTAYENNVNMSELSTHSDLKEKKKKWPSKLFKKVFSRSSTKLQETV